jgi:hypothetical protein
MPTFFSLPGAMPNVCGMTARAPKPSDICLIALRLEKWFFCIAYCLIFLPDFLPIGRIQKVFPDFLKLCKHFGTSQVKEIR